MNGCCFKRLVLLFILLINLSAFSQPVVLGDSQEVLKYPFPLFLNSAVFTADKSCSIDVEQITKQPFYPFSHFFDKVPEHLPVNINWWIKVQIDNKFLNDTTIIFYPGFQNAVTIYHESGGRFEKIAGCGNLTPESDLSIPQTRQAAYLPLQAGQLNNFYIKINNKITYHTDPFSPLLMSSSNFDSINMNLLKQGRSYGFIFFTGMGMFLIMFLYILIKWIFQKDLTYLFYAASIFFSGIYFLLSYIKEDNNQFILPNNQLFIHLISNSFFYLSIFAYWQFVRRFLYIKKFETFLGKYLTYGSRVILFVGTVSLSYALITKNLTRVIQIDTIIGAIMVVAGIFVLFGIRKVKSPLKVFIYIGILCLFIFFAIGSAYDLLRGTDYEFLPKLGSGTPFLLVGNIVEILFFTIGLAYRSKLETENIANISLLKAEAEMKALRAQMNPHFIFNCMNTIDAYIIKAAPEKASAFLNRFSKLIRLTLENSQYPLIEMEQEIESLRLFIKLESERFENSFKVNYHIDENLVAGKFKLPPLLIQPFVENAILHGVRPLPDNNGIIDIYFSEKNDLIEIQIIDNGIGIKESMRRNSNLRKHKSMALQLTKNRLALFAKNSRVSIDDRQNESGTIVTIAFPKMI